MPNKYRGEVGLDAGPDRLTLVYALNALCELEEAAGVPVLELFARLDDTASFRFRDVRLLLWGALRTHHPDVTIDQAGEISAVAGLEATLAAIGAAARETFPRPAAGEGDAADPPKAAA